MNISQQDRQAFIAETAINQGRSCKQLSNRIIVEQIPYKERFECFCQPNNSTKKQKNCKIVSNCKYDMVQDFHQNNTEITIYNDVDQKNSSKFELTQRIIDQFKDYNQQKDPQGGKRQRIKCVYSWRNAEQENDQAYFQKNKQPKLAQTYQEMFKENKLYQSSEFKHTVLQLAQILDEIFQGDHSISFVFKPFLQNKTELQETIHHALQLIQCSNQKEIYTSNDSEECSSTGSGPTKLKKDEYKITLITIQRERVTFKPNSSSQLQCINFYYDECQPMKNENNLSSLRNFNVHIDETLESFKVALKFFIKEKIKKFGSSVIVFNFKLSFIGCVDPKIFAKCVRSFKKLAQGRVIVIPMIEILDLKRQSELEQLFMNCTNQSFQGCLRSEQMVQLSQDQVIEFYERLHPQFCETAAIKQMYKSQLRTLRIQRQSMENDQQQAIIARQYPLLDNEGSLAILDINQDYDESCQQIVDYNKIEIEEYDGMVILIEQQISLIYFQEIKVSQQNSTYKKYKVVNKIERSPPKTTNGVYFYDEEKKKLFHFFGRNEEKWCSDILVQDLRDIKAQSEWQRIEWKQSAQQKLHQEKTDDSYTLDPKRISQLVEKRSKFTVAQMALSGFQNSSSYICVGGTYCDEGYRYGCIMQEVLINFREKSYTTKILQKSQADIYFKEGPNPLVMKINESFLLYFENTGNFSNSNCNAQIHKINLWKNNKYLVSSSKVSINADEKQQRLYQSLSQCFNSSCKNIRQFQLDQSPERLYQFKMIIRDKERVDLKMKGAQNEVKTFVQKYHVATFSFTASNNEIQFDAKQLQVNRIKQLPSLRDQSLKDPKGLFQNVKFYYIQSVENIKNTLLFHFNILNEEHMLCYYNIDRLAHYRRFIFDNSKEEQVSGLIYNDYRELVFQDWKQEKLHIVRKTYSKDGCTLYLLECPFINLQDIKDSQDDVLFKVQVKKQYMIKDFKRSHELMGCGVDIKDFETFEVTILTSKCWYILTSHKGTVTHTQKKHQSLHLNSRHSCILFKHFNPQVPYGLFYSNAKFAQAQINSINQNVVLLKYILFDEKRECLTDSTLKYHCEEALPINGEIEGKINSVIVINEVTIEIELVIKHKNTITKQFIYCQINEKTKQLDQVKLTQPTKYKSESGYQIYNLIQSNRKSEEYSFLDKNGDINVSFE